MHDRHCCVFTDSLSTRVVWRFPSNQWQLGPGFNASLISVFNVHLHTFSTASERSLYLSRKCTKPSSGSMCIFTFSTASERKPLSFSVVHQAFLRFNVHLHLLHSIREEAFIFLGSAPSLPQVQCASSPSPQHQRGSLYLSR
jgi:hypothetical protein